MTTPNQILVDLLSGQATADSIAGRLRVPCLVIEAMLKRHALAGLTLHGSIGDAVIVWRLTQAGTAAAIALRPARRKRSASPEPMIPTSA